MPIASTVTMNAPSELSAIVAASPDTGLLTCPRAGSTKSPIRKKRTASSATPPTASSSSRGKPNSGKPRRLSFLGDLPGRIDNPPQAASLHYSERISPPHLWCSLESCATLAQRRSGRIEELFPSSHCVTLTACRRRNAANARATFRKTLAFALSCGISRRARVLSPPKLSRPVPTPAPLPPSFASLPAVPTPTPDSSPAL